MLAVNLRPFASDSEIFQGAQAMTMSTTARMSPGNVTLHCGNHFSIFPRYVVCTNYQIKLVWAVWGLAENFKHFSSMAFCCGQNIHIIKYEIENTNILQKGVNESNYCCINMQNSTILDLDCWPTQAAHDKILLWFSKHFSGLGCSKRG